MDDLIPLNEAQHRLGISKAKMWKLVRLGLFPTYENPIDRRMKMVRWEEVVRGVRPYMVVPEDGDWEGKAAA
jgi:predicted DNA-binding transcriptional regulator AlpA